MITHLDLAELVSSAAPFDRLGWIFELKYDGFRMLATHLGKHAELVSRRGTDFSDRFPEVIAELLALPDVVLDAELVMLDENGHPVFERLIRRSRLKKRISIEHGSRTDPAVLFAFDVLELKGKDVRTWPLLDRKALLKRTLTRAEARSLHGSCRRRPRTVQGCGVDEPRGDRRQACGLALSPRATGDWIKIKTGAGRAIDVERAKWNER